MDTFESTDGELVVRLDRIDVAVESIRRACEVHDVDSGIIVSGIGTVSDLSVHSVRRSTTRGGRDDRSADRSNDGTWDVAAMTGVITDGEPHVHGRRRNAIRRRCTAVRDDREDEDRTDDSPRDTQTKPGRETFLATVT